MAQLAYTVSFSLLTLPCGAPPSPLTSLAGLYTFLSEALSSEDGSDTGSDAGSAGGFAPSATLAASHLCAEWTAGRGDSAGELSCGGGSGSPSPAHNDTDASARAPAGSVEERVCGATPMPCAWGLPPSPCSRATVDSARLVRVRVRVGVRVGVGVGVSVRVGVRVRFRGLAF